jgi:tyrosyl-tRNA synthetase
LDKRKTETHYNSAWLKKLGFHEIGALADLFGLHEFEARENVARRMKEGKRVSLREVLYPLMQGYDSVAVEADVELGGTDQKFNLLAGRTIQAKYNLPAQDIVMTKLLRGTDGRKMSSSWGNVVRLDDEPSEMFGKIMSLHDELMPEYFLLCTDISGEIIREILAENPRDGKMRLAHEIVKLYHGERSADAAQEEFIHIFSNKEKPEDMPIIRLGRKEISLLDLLIETKLVLSKSEARRLIEQSGVRLNDEKKMNPEEIISLKEESVLQVGKRRFAKITF